MSIHDPTGPLRILIVDDHSIVREGMKRVLEGASPLWVVVETASGFQATERLREGAFDVGIFDLSMPGMSGLDLLRRARAGHPSLLVLILSMHDEEQYAIRAFRAGANGYVTKDSAARELADAVRKVVTGGAYVSAILAERMLLRLNGAIEPMRHTQLSDREFEVLRRIVSGQRPAEIALTLHLSVKTVSSHKTRILRKLGLPNTVALIRYGIEQGLISNSVHTSKP